MPQCKIYMENLQKCFLSGIKEKGMYFKIAFLITKKEQCLKHVVHTGSWDCNCEWAAVGSALILGVMTGQQGGSGAPGDP